MSDTSPTGDSIPQSFVAAVKERLSHPVAGVFAIAWILFNWRMLFTLAVSGSPAEQRINVALTYTDWRIGLAFPAGFTIAYLAISPWLQVLVSRWNGWVSEKQSLRAYRDSLVQLQRQTEIEQRAMHTMQPLLRGQQEQKVKIEKEIERLARQKDEMQDGIQLVVNINPEQWKGIQIPNTAVMDTVRERLNRMEEMTKILRAKYPELAEPAPMMTLGSTPIIPPPPPNG